jgi:hypothetical protein
MKTIMNLEALDTLEQVEAFLERLVKQQSETGKVVHHPVKGSGFKRQFQEWANPLTVINYPLLGSASSFTLAAALAAWEDSGLVTFYAMWAVIITLTGFATRMYSLRRNAHLKRKTTACTAIGVRHPKITQISQGQWVVHSIPVSFSITKVLSLSG